ncbi:unnamed protein product [Rhizoctonia solani]|uniref:DUF1764 domain-containing protein n=1 Tax=Rhizoctonia solani TaxID=456999 RepID=A0A8H2XW26_9AGAM|nr:unnamed protein product [Rhizoctonia solani]
MGEIDEIFSGKTKAKGKLKEAEPSSTPKDKVISKKKKSKKPTKSGSLAKDSVGHDEPVEIPTASTAAKRKVPETVVDPSTEVESKSKKLKPSKQGKKSAVVDSDDERFRDSRGTGPRRKTEEGFFIYKEDELGINDEGGDTPLCPFDCDCCF